MTINSQNKNHTLPPAYVDTNISPVGQLMAVASIVLVLLAL